MLRNKLQSHIHDSLNSVNHIVHSLVCGSIRPVLRKCVRIGPRVQLPQGVSDLGRDGHWRGSHGNIKANHQQGTQAHRLL